MNKAERKSYISAVQCLQKLPSKSDPTFAPAAKSRYDDFVAVHVNQTQLIHGNGLFLTWHRYFVWAYEQALRNECGYKGYQPVCRDPSCYLRSVSNLPSTGTGSPTRTTSTSPPCLMAVTPAWAATVNSSRTMEVLPVLGRL
jgi:hypothetical protein